MYCDKHASERVRSTHTVLVPVNIRLFAFFLTQCPLLFDRTTLSLFFSCLYPFVVNRRCAWCFVQFFLNRIWVVRMEKMLSAMCLCCCCYRWWRWWWYGGGGCYNETMLRFFYPSAGRINHCYSFIRMKSVPIVEGFKCTQTQTYMKYLPLSPVTRGA